jgi:flagellar protein FlaF
MGFSVSGATALLFVAFLLSFGTFYTATMGAVEQVQEAQIDKQDSSLTTLNTEIDILSAEYSGNDGELTITADNTGAEPLNVTDVSLLVNGTYTEFGTGDVTLSNPEGELLWVPQQRLVLTISEENPPSFSDGETVKLVTENAVADTAQITEVS